MGYHDENYKGFYIVATPNIKTETIEETRCTNNSCANSKIEMKDGFAFCPKCGSKIDWVDVIKETKESFNYISGTEVPDVSDGMLHDWFWSPEYINGLIGEDWSYVKWEKSDNIIICNRNFGANTPDKREKFLYHPATKFLLEKMNCKYEVHFGLVQYSA